MIILIIHVTRRVTDNIFLFSAACYLNVCLAHIFWVRNRFHC